MAISRGTARPSRDASIATNHRRTTTIPLVRRSKAHVLLPRSATSVTRRATSARIAPNARLARRMVILLRSARRSVLILMLARGADRESTKQPNVPRPFNAPSALSGVMTRLVVRQSLEQSAPLAIRHRSRAVKRNPPVLTKRDLPIPTKRNPPMPRLARPRSSRSRPEYRKPQMPIVRSI